MVGALVRVLQDEPNSHCHWFKLWLIASRGSTFFGRRSGLSFARAAASRYALVMQSGQRHPAGAASPGGTGLISPSPERSAQLPGKVGSVDKFLDRPVQQAVPVQPPQYFGSLPVSDRPVQREYLRPIFALSQACIPRESETRQQATSCRYEG